MFTTLVSLNFVLAISGSLIYLNVISNQTRRGLIFGKFFRRLKWFKCLSFYYIVIWFNNMTIFHILLAKDYRFVMFNMKFLYNFQW